jgi:hypothetical protein
MELKEALAIVGNGHIVVSEEGAHKVCEAFGVSKVKCYPLHSDPPGTHKGLTLNEGAEGELGISGVGLGDHVVGELGLEVHSFIGRGFQAQANAQAIAEHFAK